MDTLLGVASLAAQTTYLTFFFAALWAEYRVKTLAGLRKASQRYWTATALSVVALVINLASVPYDGWLQVAVSTFTAGACLGCARMADRARDRRVIAELQRDLGRES